MTSEKYVIQILKIKRNRKVNRKTKKVKSLKSPKKKFIYYKKQKLPQSGTPHISQRPTFHISHCPAPPPTTPPTALHPTIHISQCPRPPPSHCSNFQSCVTGARTTIVKGESSLECECEMSIHLILSRRIHLNMSHISLLIIGFNDLIISPGIAH